MSTDDRIKAKFQALIQEGQKILSSCGFDGMDQYREHPSDIDYRRFRVEAMNIVRRVCGETSDHYKELQRIAEDKEIAINSYYFKDCFGILQAAQKDYEGEFLFDLRALVAAEVIGDFIDQAEVLVTEGYHVPAASLAGAVLEDTLRKMCEANGISIPERTKIDRLNADLARAEVYNKLIQKRITALADIRNNADHGRFEEFTKSDVIDMVDWVRKFTADHLE